MDVKGLAISMGLGVAAGAVGILMMSRTNPTRKLASQAADKLELMGKENVRLIVNRIQKKMTATVGLTVDDIMDQAGVPLLGIVPEDSNVTLSAAFRQPLLGYTNRGAAAACRRIAKRLLGQRVKIKL